MRAKLMLVSISFTCVSLTSISQIGNWWFYLGNNYVSDRLLSQNEIQIRNFDLNNNNQILIRNGIGYDLSENNNNILLGYAFIRTTPIKDNNYSSFNEHRIYQQFITKQSFKRLILTHRFRTEERIINRDLNFRFRYFIMANFTLNNQTLKKGTFYLSFMNESFVAPRGDFFDRNRTSLGIGYVINDHLKIQTDFLHQEVKQPNTDSNQILITLFSTIRWNSEH